MLVLAAGWGDGGRDAGSAGQAPATTAATTAPATTAAAAAKACLQDAERDRAVSFTTGAGATLVGVVLGSGRRGLVLGHQSGRDLCEWLPLARELAGRGYQVLPVRDKRLLVVPGGGHGTSLLEFGSDAPKVQAGVWRFVAGHTRQGG